MNLFPEDETLTIKLCDVNPHITCAICKGYLIDATTITECLHTFCKSCIVKHLEDDNRCPRCHSIIHQSHPLQYISYDRTMQDIVYKIVPGLQEDEYRRQKTYYRSRGLPWPRQLEEQIYPNLCNDGNEQALDNNGNDHRHDEQINVYLLCDSNQQQLKRRFIRCSAYATVYHIKKFIAKKLNLKTHKDLDILCNEEVLGKDHTLKFINVTRWRFQDGPLKLIYKPVCIS